MAVGAFGLVNNVQDYLKILEMLFENTLKKFLSSKKKDISVKVGSYSCTIPSDMAWCFKDGDFYETNVIYWFDRLLKIYNVPVIYDIGANYGYYTLRYADTAQKIYSFEPVSKTFKYLSQNIISNKIENVQLFNIGLSNTEDKKIINLYNSSGNNSIFERQIPEGHGLKKTGEEEIELKVLDDLVTNQLLQPPSIIKIDVEGAELFVLMGAKQVIQEHKPIILIEYAASTSNDAGYEKERIIEEIGSGYIMYGIPGNEKDLQLIPYQEFDKHDIANIIAIPNHMETEFLK